MEKQLKILITGATGKSGGAAIDELLQMGYQVRALVHSNDERSEKLTARGVEVFVGDLLNLDEISTAMQSIDTAYFCYPVLVPGVLQATAYFAQAAVENRLKGIVNMSQISAKREAKSNAAQDHWVGEQILNRTGIPVVHLRPTFFDDWFLYIREGIQHDNAIVLPFGEGRWAPVDSADLGRVVAKIATSIEEYAGQVLKLYGPEEFSVFEMSDVISRVLGRTVKYEPVTIEHFFEINSKRAASEHFVQHVTHVADDCINGIFAGTNGLIEMITQRKPTTLSGFFNQNKALFS
ncbi:NmrA family NAD(P)-binding protein [Mucilaginibacter aquaedulcis]|uniref:NmrA family NAD(P)-binding protein n=1 Tax=Mucilaginibacter aquaedulcis TaxID=1187081 RepID=UPI0025B57343|nr:NmrA family NAD(P)-binding protein [Mucilaginibacter aquaedulcis]MDN3549199.1 NmrA family NAD(P)-binding protein [Mucilaginibacter aquaedulcis]